METRKMEHVKTSYRDNIKKTDYQRTIHCTRMKWDCV